MYASARKALATYNEVGVETGVAAADPHRLILMLFEGALVAVGNARRAVEKGELAAKGAAIAKAIAIIDGGLKASLDMRAGGQLAERLASLYDYACRRLLYANLKNDRAVLEEVARLLGELRDAWAQIGDRDSVRSK